MTILIHYFIGNKIFIGVFIMFYTYTIYLYILVYTTINYG